jgi:hypothetical protein
VFYGDWSKGYILGDENLIQIKHANDIIPRLPGKFKSLGTHYVITDLADSVLTDAKKRLTPKIIHWMNKKALSLTRPVSNVFITSGYIPLYEHARL